VVAIAFEALLGGTRGEVSGPVAVVVTAIGEEVLGLVGPGLETFMERVEVASGGGVEKVEGGALGLTLINVPRGGVNRMSMGKQSSRSSALT